MPGVTHQRHVGAPLETPKAGAGFRRERRPGAPPLRILSAAEELVGSALNPFAGLLYVFSEAVGSPAADADNGEEPGDKKQKNETLNQRDLICYHCVIIIPGIRAGAMGCSPHLRFWSGIILAIPHSSLADYAMVAAVRAGRPPWRAPGSKPRG